ncbi:NAD-dependent epimerase/dehydratase family protein [uncultured Paludibaculum sp.]|uniref:NAD-dependent epimerase/dehydratase family protein n=1 Tax=uncultured Paludibaculum sp. TaxID=1765020 RepID=UPI002AAAE621|nr:NAD-dependent epimerase/dehydratase family protein [uncultured Paludibaculum sp.]
MKVLVTGATGYIGSAVCEALKSAGHQPAGLARSEERAHLLESRGFVARRGDLTDLDSLRAAVADADAVIHAADASSSDRGDIAKAAVGAMLAALAGSRRPFVYTSGVWVVGDTDGRMVGEICALHPPALVAWRPEVETMVIEAKDNGVKTMVLRPGMVFGRRGGVLASFFADARTRGAVRIIGTGANYWSNTHIDDLADLYVRAISTPAGGELFFACGGMPQPVEKIARAVAKACGVEGKVESVPLETARQQLGPVADCLAMDCRAGSTKAARYFGWTVNKPSIFDEIFSGSYAN